MSKMFRYEVRVVVMMGEREKILRRGRLLLEDKMNVYVDRFLVEVIILG